MIRLKDLINEDVFVNTNKKGKINLCFLGDIMCERDGMNSVINGDPFYFLKKYLNDKEFVIGNLETTLSGHTSDYPHFSSDDRLAEYLKQIVNCLCTANNHCLDYGFYGLKRTVEILRNVGLTTTGTFTEEYNKPFEIIDIGKHKISLINFTQFINKKDKIYKRIDHPSLIPTDCADFISFYDDEYATKLIKIAKETSDITIVSIHCDTIELSRQPDTNYFKFLKSIIDAGADLVVGGHPHYFQGGKELDKGKAVIYSLGNFYSTMFNPPKYMENSGCILNVSISDTGNMEYTFLPVATILHRGNGLLYVLPLPLVEKNDMFEWLDTDQRQMLLSELKHMRKILKDCSLKEEKI